MLIKSSWLNSSLELALLTPYHSSILVYRSPCCTVSGHMPKSSTIETSSISSSLSPIYRHRSWSLLSSCQSWCKSPLLLPTSSRNLASPECSIVPRGSLPSWLLRISHCGARRISSSTPQNPFLCSTLPHVAVLSRPCDTA